MTSSQGAADAGLDHVTGLRVRSMFEGRLASLLERPGPPPSVTSASFGGTPERSRPAAVVLVICDVVGLKQINENHGFRRGDEVLAAAAKRFRAATASADLQARLGGDELVAIFVGEGAASDAATAVGRLSSSSSPVLRAAATSLTPDDTADTLIDRLYAAMRTS